MSGHSAPTISAVIAAYQAEAFIAEAVDSILGQTRPPDEVVVVNDGSTDGTGAELRRFGDRIRVVDRSNGGCPAAFNTAFRTARGDFVAMCGADDIWDPRKLEWQLETIRSYPEVDVLFGHATFFGSMTGEHARPPIFGLLDGEAFRSALFRANCVCAPTIVIRRSLFEELGPFIEDFGADDYEYWFRCLRAGARFFYDPRTLVGWRKHDANLTRQYDWMDESACVVRCLYAGDLADRATVRETLAPALFRRARRLVEEGRARDARRAFLGSLRHARGGTPSDNVRALAWVVVLSLPGASRERLSRGLVRLRRAVLRRLASRQATAA